VAGKIFAQSFQRSIDTHFCRTFANAHRRADFLHAFAAKKTQYHRLAIRFAQVGHSGVQQRGNLAPDVGFVFVQNTLHLGLLLALNTPDFTAHKGN
jgi:hypothetical protein